MRKGWCPTLFTPMPSGDGLLVRVRPPGGMFTAAAARTLAQAAEKHGNGTIELTSRAGLQLRGFRADTAPPFATEIVAAGLAHLDPDAERRRSVIAPPLMHDDPSASPRAAEVVAALEGMLEREARLAALPDKFGILVDAGGLLPTAGAPADIRVLLYAPSPNLLPQRDAAFLMIDGSDLAAPCDPADVANAVLRLALAFLDLGARHCRMRAVVAELGASAIFASAGLSPAATVTLPPAPNPFGRLAYRGTDKSAFGAGLPFAATDAATLFSLADIAQEFGDGRLRLTPWRAFIISGVTTPDAVRVAVEELGLITAPDDFRARIFACPGKPLCSSATVSTRDDVARIAAAGFAGRVHVSGCNKGCAHPGIAGLTLVGDNGRYSIVRNGRAADPPAHSGLTLAETLAAIGAKAFA